MDSYQHECLQLCLERSSSLFGKVKVVMQSKEEDEQIREFFA